MELIIQGIRRSLNHSIRHGLQVVLDYDAASKHHAWRLGKTHGHGMPWENEPFVDDLWPLSMAQHGHGFHGYVSAQLDYQRVTGYTL